MATKLTPTQKRSLEVAALFRNTDWSEDPSVLAYKREQADRLAAAEALRQEQMFANVQGGSSSTEMDQPEGFLSNVGSNLGGLVDRAQGGLQSLAAGYIQSAADADALAAAEAEQPWYRRDFISPLAAQADAAIVGLFSDDIQATATGLQEASAANMSAADLAAEQAADYSRQITGNIPLVGGAANTGFEQINRAAGDVVSAPDSFASVFGGPVGIVAGGGGEFYRSYGQARQDGLSPSDAREYASQQASVVTATSFFPSGRFVSAPINAVARRVGGRALSDVVQSDARKVAGRVATGGLGEGAQEGGQYLAQLGVNKLLAETDDGDIGRHANDQLPTDIWNLIDNTWRNSLAGALGGGVLHTPMAGVQVAIERGKLADEALASNNAIVNKLAAARENAAQTQFENRRAEELASRRQQGQLEIASQEAFEQEQAGIEQGRNELAQLTGTQITGGPFLTGFRDPSRAFTSTDIVPVPERGTPVQDPNRPVSAPTEAALLAEAERTAAAVTNRQASLTAIDNADAKRLSAAKTKRNADLRKHLNDTLKTVQGLPDADRADALAAARSEWLASNPEPTLESIKAQPAAAPKAKRPQESRTAALTTVAPVVDEAAVRELVPDATPQEVATAVESSAQRLEKLKQQAAANPLPTTTDTTSTGSTVASVITGIKNKLMGSDAKIAAKLMADGNMVIVPDASYVPGNADPRGVGFYDGQRTYVVADKISGDNVMGDVMSILSHEVKHAGDVGGKSLPKGIQFFIGKKANDQLNTKIRALANTTDPLAFAAKNAVAYADQSDNPDLELSAAFIQGARDVQNAKGAGARILNNLVSGVRTGAKRVMGGDVDINLNDVAYLSQKLMEEAAISGQRLTGDVTQPMPMIYPDTAPGFAQALTENRVYESVDGRQKFVLPDSGSSLKPEADSLKDGDVTFLGDIMNHPLLMEQFPQAANIPVAVESMTNPGQFAKYNTVTKEITVDPRILRGNLADGTDLRGAILHEVQHWVQDRGGQSDNFFIGEQAVQSQEERDAAAEFQAASDARQTAARRVLDNIMPAINGIRNPDVKRSALDVLKDINMEDRDKAGEIIGILEDVDSVPNSLDPLIEAFRARSAEASTAATTFNDLKRPRETAYLSNLSEREAFYTQDNASNESVPVNPEAEFAPGPITNRAGTVLGNAPVAPPPMPTFMTPRAKERFKNSWFAKAVVAQSRFHSGLGEELFDSLKTSEGEAGIYAQHGERAGAAVDRGIRRFAEANNITFKQSEARVKALMDKIVKLPSPDLRRRALAHAASNDPTLAPLAEAHSEIAQLTDQLVVNLLRSNPNPTAKDMEFYTSLLDNTYGYTTRIFSSTQGRAGTAYAKRLWKDWEDAKDKLVKGKKLSENEQDALSRVDNAINYMAEHELSIPPADSIDQITNSKLEYLYGNWIGNFDNDYSNMIAEGQRNGMEEPEAVAAARQGMIDRLAEARDTADSDELQDRAMDAVRELIGLNSGTSTLPPGKKRGPADKGILQKRTDLPDVLRSVMGEITDPSTMVAITMAKQGELVARQKFLNDLRDRYTGEWVVPPNATSQGVFTETLNGKEWGALEGWQAKPEIVATIGDTLGMYNAIGDAAVQGFAGVYSPNNEFISASLNKLRSAAGLFKVASVIAEPFGMLMNAGGSVGILAANGVVNPKYVIRAGRVAWDSIINNAIDQKGKLSPMAERAIKYGVLESVRVNELKTSSHQHILSKIEERAPLSNVRGKLGTGFRIARNTTIDIFAQADAWAKVAAFEARIDLLKKYYNAEGVTKTEDQLAQEAATHVKRTNISSDRVPPALKTLESYGATTFMPYFYSVPRALSQSAWVGAMDVKRAFTEATTTEGRMALAVDGLKRMAGAGAATYGMLALTRGIAAGLNEDDDDKVKKLAMMMAPEMRFGDPVWLGEDDTGVPVFFRTSRLDPYGPLNDQLRILLDPNSKWQDIEGTLKESLTSMVFANRFTGLVFETGAALLAGGDTYRKDMRLARLMPQTVSAIRDMGDMLGLPGTVVSEGAVRAADVLTPGWLDALDPKNKNALPNEKGGEALGALIIGSGGKLDRADPAARAYQLGRDVEKVRKDAAKAIDEARRAGRDDDHLFSLAQRADNNAFGYMRQLTDLYQGMTTGLGMSKRKAMAVLSDAGLDAKDVAMIVRGEIPKDKDQLTFNQLGRAISISSMEAQARTRDRNKTITEQKAELQAIRDFRKKLRERGIRLEE